MSDQSDLFGPIDALPGARLPERLDHGAGADPYGALREASAAWLREGGEGDAFGRALVSIEPLLGRSYLLGQPNLAGMGVAPWDLVRSVASEAVTNPMGRARRMVGQGVLGDLLTDDDEDEADAPEDRHAMARGADLLEAMQRLTEAATSLPDGAPDAVYDQLQALRADLADRLRRERRQAPALDRALISQNLADAEAVARLRRPAGAARPEADADAVQVVRAAPPRRLADDAPDAVVAEEPSWPQPMGPAPEMAPSPGRAAAKTPPTADLAQLARMVSAETGRPLGELLAEALEGQAPAPRRDKGAAASEAQGSVSVAHVHIDGLAGADPGVATVLQSALQALPGVLERVLADRGGAAALDDRTARVDLTLGLAATDAPATVARRIADRILREGARRVGALHLGVDASAPAVRETPRSLLGRLAAEDDDGIAAALASERRTLDGALRDRLSRFFGDDFKDVLVFAGPMAGALARSLSAEAVTHGNMVFFDPKHFRLDTAKGEALVAHELAHTRQTDDRDSRLKEAEALRAEAAYLSWIQPGGAPFAEEDPLDPTAPSAAAADGGSMLAAKEDRHLEQSAGPRADQAEHEKRLEQVMGRVRELLAEDVLNESDRYGRVSALRRLRL